MENKIEEIDKLLKDNRIPQNVRKSLEKKKEILSNDKDIKK